MARAVAAKWLAPPSEVVAIDRGNHHVLEAEASHGRGDPQGLERIEALWGAVLDSAEAAAARARLPHQHERRGRVRPALADVRTERLLTDCREVQLAEDSASAKVRLANGSTGSEPCGFSLPAYARIGLGEPR